MSRAAREDLTLPVIDAIAAYQALEDTDPIRAALAAASTVDLDSEPLWLQLVGGSSSGKTEAIAMLRDIADGRVGEITVPGLLGWTGGEKNGKPTGLLHRIGDGHKLVTINDFSTVLADSDRGRRAALFSFLRVLYDGYAVRDISGRHLEWEGRVTLVSGVTPQIDAFSAHADALGPRWMYCRIPELTNAGRSRAAAYARSHASRKEPFRMVSASWRRSRSRTHGSRSLSTSTRLTGCGSTTRRSSPPSAARTFPATGMGGAM